MTTPPTKLMLRPCLDGKEEDAIPSKYTTALHAAIVQSIRRGNNKMTAAVACGLPRTTLASWLASYSAGDAHPCIVQLVEDMDRAYALAEVAAVDAVTAPEAGEEKMSATRAMWVLEHSRGAEWNKQSRVVVTNEIEGVLDRLQAGLSPGEFAKVLALLGSE